MPYKTAKPKNTERDTKNRGEKGIESNISINGIGQKQPAHTQTRNGSASIKNTFQAQRAQNSQNRYIVRSI